MQNVLLVDDDFLVRSYLKMLPSWEKSGFEIIADVRDGEEALEVMERAEIELVVTDIAMPLMDGIRLIREIRKRYTGIYVIVLSCHDEFEYVKEAMKEGADEYVLKNTLNEESLYTLLQTAKEKLASRKMREADVLQEKKKAVHSNAAYSSDINRKFLFFNRLLTGTWSDKEWEREREAAGIHGKYQNSAVIVMKLEDYENQEDPWSEVKKEQYCLEFMKRFQHMADEMAAEMKIEEDVIYVGNGVFCCFVDLSDMCRSSVMYQNLTNMASACYRICRVEEYVYQIGVSNICIGAEAVRQAYQQARLMVKAGFYDSDGITYYEPDKVMKKELPKEASILIEQLDKIREKGGKEEFRKLSKVAIEAFQREWTDSTIVRHWLKQMEQRIPGPIKEEKWTVRTIEEAGKVLEKIADRLFVCENVSIPEQISKPVRKAAEYAAEHYREAIGLNEAAEAAGVNSTYLSYLFRQEMGIGFASYLLNLRLEHAKKLLKESDLKIWQIAEKSGFHDYHYFSKVFKKAVGMSPAQYGRDSGKR